MSTTGHYNRYFKMYPGWSDNCDTMFRRVYVPGMHQDCKSCEYQCAPGTTEEKRCDLCPYSVGYLQAEHYKGNKTAFCQFIYDGARDFYRKYAPVNHNNDQLIKADPVHAGNNFMVITYSGKLALEHVIEQAEKINPADLVDLAFGYEFYNRSYSDIIPLIIDEVPA